MESAYNYIFGKFSSINMANSLSTLAKNLKAIKTINLGGDKSINNALDCLAAILKMVSTKLSKRSILKTADNDTCLLSIAKAFNAILKVIPNKIVGLHLENVKMIVKIAKLACAILDVMINYKKLFPDGVTAKGIGLLSFECVKMLAKVIISHQIPALLEGTPLQFLSGPIVFYIGQLFALIESANYSFLRDGLEEVYGNTLNLDQVPEQLTSIKEKLGSVNKSFEKMSGAIKNFMIITNFFPKTSGKIINFLGKLPEKIANLATS